MSTPARDAFRLIPLGLLLLSVGCSAPAEEERDVTYELIRTQAGNVPALLGESEGCEYRAAAGAVTLGSEGSFDASLVRLRTCPESADTFFDTGSGRYTTQGDSVYFHYGAGGSAGVGIRAGDSLVVIGTGQTMTYRRTDL